MSRLIICCLFLIWGTASYGAEVPYSISINAPQNVVKSGQTVSLDITATSNSLRTVRIPITDLRAGIKVWREDGAPVNLTREGRYLHGQPNATDIKEDKYWFSRSQPNGHGAGLEAGGVYKDSVMVNQFYNMAAPGDYFIQIEQSVAPFPPGLIIKSNVITVTITN